MKKLVSIIFALFFIQFSVIAQEDNAMIVFDASGSMWGQVGGKPKISIAKKALEKVVTDWNEDIHLGFIAYGHRKKGDCNDIQVLTPIGEVNKKDLISKVKKIQPKGKTPISRSLKKAAEALKFTEEKATVILISDGKETCDADPCATAKALESKGIDFVAHVIGFAVDKQTGKQLKCIADVTGGEYFSANDASALNAAMGTIVNKVEKVAPLVVKNNKLQITAAEVEGGKWVKARHYIYNAVDGKKEGSYIKSCTSTKKKACEYKLPVGSYTIETVYSKKTQWTPFELPAEPFSLNVITGKTGKLDLTATEKEGGKWVKARHYIYNVVDSEKDGSYIISCTSTKKKACAYQLPVGSYTIETVYSKKTHWTPFELPAELLSLSVVTGKTGKIDLTATEKEGGKWVKSRHYIYKVLNGEKEGSYIISCTSTKKKTCQFQIPVGSYTIESVYNKIKKWTPFEVTPGKVPNLNIVMGATGKAEITVSEKEGGKWVKAKNWIYKIVDGETESNYTHYCNSTKKKSCLAQLPEDHYSLHTEYNKIKKDTLFEINAKDLAKLQIVMGGTGKAEITVSEKEGGKWVKAKNWVYKIEDGEVESNYTHYCNSSKKKSCLAQLPEGHYSLLTQYNKLKKNTLFEIKTGELLKLAIAMGQTGKVEITASEKKGGRWVKAKHWLYKIVDGEKASNYTEYCNSTKKKACAVQIPEGHYNLYSTFDKFKKNTLIEVTSSGVSKTHVTFAQFFVASICSGMNEIITHEIYASSGRLVYDKQAKCSDKLNVPLENGQYTIESKVGNETKESSFTLGGDNPNQITIDMRKKDTEEESHKDLIEADKKASAEVMAPKASTKSTTEKTVESPKPISVSKEVQAFKKGILASLPPLKGVKECYESAGDLVQAKLCEDLEELAFMVAMDAMKGSEKPSQLVKHTEWNDEIKKQTVDKTAKDIKSMELSVKCIDKGAGFYNLEKCIAHDGAL